MKNDRRSILMAGNFLSEHLSTRSVCEDLAERLRGNGWRVYTTSNRVRRLGRLADMLRSIWRWRKEFEVAQVDVYSGAAFVWAEAVCGLLGLLRKPYVLTLHGGNLPKFSQRWPKRVTRLLRSAGAVTTPSRYLEEQMRSYREDLELLPNPLDLRRYRFECREKASPRLVWLRAFHSIYNPGMAARVVAELARDVPEVQLLMVGPDKGEGSLRHFQQLSMELGVSGRIEITGGVSKQSVPDFLNRGDVFLNTTNVDNTPVSVLEAMACGLPVVSTNVGGIPYLLKDEETALLVGVNESGEMAQAVRRLLGNSGLASGLSRRGRRMAEACDWAHVLPRWERVLEGLASGRVSESLPLAGPGSEARHAAVSKGV